MSSKDWINFGFLRFSSNPLMSKSKVDTNHKFIELNERKADYVKSAFKSLNNFWTNNLNEKSLQQCFSSNENQKKRMFEVNKNFIFNTKSDQHLNAWKTNQTKNESQKLMNNNKIDLKCDNTIDKNSALDKIDMLSDCDHYYSQTNENSSKYNTKNVNNKNMHKLNFDVDFIDQKSQHFVSKDEHKFNNNNNNNSLYSDISFNDTIYGSIIAKTNKRKNRKKSSNRNKCLVSEFIDCEAEVVLDTIESYSDDEENTQKELSGCSSSFVNDNTLIDSQPIRQLIGGIDSRSTEDMKSVYLQSVKDRMIGDVFKYKLQYDYDPSIDVYSQEPDQSEMTDYELDSFCVANDCVVYDNSSPIQSKLDISSESPSPQMKLRQRKKFKRIIFNP